MVRHHLHSIIAALSLDEIMDFMQVGNIKDRANFLHISFKVAKNSALSSCVGNIGGFRGVSEVSGNLLPAEYSI